MNSGSAATLRTERLELTPASPDDLDVLLAIWRDRDVRRYLWDDREADRETARAVLERDAHDWTTHRYGLWLVREHGRAEVIGFAGFRAPEEGDEPELIYGLLPAYWHRGYATEAARAALRYLFEEVGRAAAWANTDAPNVASIAVMERLGMEPQPGGPYVRYRITRERFAPRQSADRHA